MLITNSRTEKDLLGKAVERTPQVEQVNLNGGRLLREAKVRILCNKLNSFVFSCRCVSTPELLFSSYPSHALTLSFVPPLFPFLFYFLISG